MKATVRNISGFEEMFGAMYISKRSWTQELQAGIDKICKSVLTRYGSLDASAPQNDIDQFNKWLSMALKMGRKHITILRFLDISIMTEGLHRAGQDDVDAHAVRFNNRIIRNSTRLANFGVEKSDFYIDKILTTDEALKQLGVDIPDKFTDNTGQVWLKASNGYIKEELAENKDVKRGLYMLSIPSNFISKINLCEWGHVFKERNKDGAANPEVKEWAEEVMQGLTEYIPLITRDYVLTIEN